MKLKKLAAGLLAAVVAVTSSVIVPVTASAADAPYVNVKGYTASWAMNIDYAGKTTFAAGTDQYTIELTNAEGEPTANTNGVYNDSFAGGAIALNFMDPSGVLTDFSVVSVSVNGVDKGVSYSKEDAEFDEYLWDGATSAAGYCLTFTEDDLTAIGAINLGESIEIVVSATYDDSIRSIGADNFEYSVLQDTEMAIGDSFTITYDSENTPDTAKYSFKYKIPNETDYDYYSPVNENAVNADTSWNGASETGLEVTATTSGTVTTYTFTAVSASVDAFELNIEVSALGDWSDTQYLWFGSATAYKVLPADVYPTTIEISGEENTVKVGEEITLSAEVSNENGDEITTDKTVTWSADASGNVTVDEDGVVTGVASGSATVTASVEGENGDITDTYEITVTNPVTSISIDATAGILEGATKTLTVKSVPETPDAYELVWTSSDDAVATVADGVVTGVKAGTADITATVKDTDISAVCKVTVTADTVAVTGVKLDKTELDLTKDGTAQLTATVAPEDATDTAVEWTSDKPAVATVDENGKVTAVASGEATITVTTKDGAKTASCKVTVKEAASETAYTYTYDGSAIELTLSVPSWDATQLNGQKNIDIVPTGVKLQTTTFAELKALYSGIAVEDWAVNNLTEGASESAISVSIYIQNGSGWAWNAFNGTSVDFADITAIADSDPIMGIGFQINYNATGSDFKSGDVIVINGEKADSALEDGEYSDGTYQQLEEADIPSMAFGEADVDVDEFDLTKNTYNSTFKDGKLYIYNYVSEELVESANGASVIVRYKDAKALRLTTSCVYTALDADTKAEDGMVFLAFVIDGLSADENDALYYGNYSWTHIETN